MPVELTSKGLPIWTLESVPEQYRQRLLACKDNSPWRHCLVCDAAPAEKLTYKCSECNDPGLEIVDPVRYCSVTCQKAHWPIHRQVCGEAKVIAREMVSSIPYNDGLVRRYRWVTRRAHALLGFGGLFDWAARQMFLHSGMSLETVRKNRVIFVISDMDVLHIALFLGRLHYEPRDQTQDSETEPPGHYEVRWYNGSEGTFSLAFGSFHLDNTEGELFSARVPQWLWVFRQCCVAGDLHPKKAQVRLELLVNTLLAYRDPNGLLNEFQEDGFMGWQLNSDEDAPRRTEETHRAKSATFKETPARGSVPP